MDSSRVLLLRTWRCPFCHDGIAAEADWLACRQCLARHHAACWRETGRCASCTGDEPLVSGSSTPLRAGEEEIAALRRETELATRAAARRDERTARFILGLATFGIQPAVEALLAFGSHARAGDDHGSVLLRVERARRASEASTGAGVVLMVGAFLILAPIVGVFAYSAWSLIEAAIVLGRSPFERPDFSGVYGFQLTLWAPTFTLLHVFREAVRRHELEQTFARLVGDALPPLAVSAYVELTARGWSWRRLADLLLTVAGLIPFAGVLALAVAGVRVRGALALHEEDELLFPRKNPAASGTC
jgi:hypothetical protein